MKYMWKSDETALAEKRSADLSIVLVLRGVIEMSGKRYFLTAIDKSVFANCAIQSVGIPSNIEVIGEFCFCRCEFLCVVTFELDSKLKEIGKSAFKECEFKSIRIPRNIEVIGEKMFFNVRFCLCSYV
jgi:hypothetical protein